MPSFSCWNNAVKHVPAHDDASRYVFRRPYAQSEAQRVFRNQIGGVFQNVSKEIAFFIKKNGKPSNFKLLQLIVF
mgnify:CR=1 FL=1